MRLSIEIAESDHQKIKALAAMNGQSIKDYILEKALHGSELEALEQLKTYLAPRIAEAKRGELYEGTMDDLLKEIHAEHRQRN